MGGPVAILMEGRAHDRRCDIAMFEATGLHGWALSYARQGTFLMSLTMRSRAPSYNIKEISLETGVASSAKGTGLTGRAMIYIDQEMSSESYRAISSWMGYAAKGLRDRTVFLEGRATNFL